MKRKKQKRTLQRQPRIPHSITAGFAAITVVAGASFIVPHVSESFTDTNETPPQGNVEAPINIGPDDQWKEGNLGIGTSNQPTSKLEVEGVTNLRGNVFVESGNDVYADDMWVGEENAWLTDLLDQNDGIAGKRMNLMDRNTLSRPWAIKQQVVQKGDYIYVYGEADNERLNGAKLTALDISTPNNISISPSQPRRRDEYEFNLSDSFGYELVGVKDGYAFLHRSPFNDRFSSLRVVDVSDPSNMTVERTFSQNQLESGNSKIRRMAVDVREGRRYLYVSKEQGNTVSFITYDITNWNLSQTSSIQIASQSTNEIGSSITLFEDKVLLSAPSKRAAKIVNLADVANPQISNISFSEKLGFAIQIRGTSLFSRTVEGSYDPSNYLWRSDARIKIFDLSNGDLKTKIEHKSTSFVVRGDTMYWFKEGPALLYKADISEESNPTIVDTLQLSSRFGFVNANLVTTRNHVFPLTTGQTTGNWSELFSVRTQ